MRLPTLPLLLAITASLDIPAALAATTGTLTFQGVVNAGTCNLNAGDVNRTITLPAVKVSDFDTTDSAGEHDFELAADCDSDVKNVIFQFAGTPSAGNAELFANTGTSGGTALWLASTGIIPANGTEVQRSRTVATSASKAVLPLKAAYHKTGEAITHGTLASAVTVSITYN
ncbi:MULTISPECIES: fimbrial protein [Pseudomonas]|uniref:Pilus assembly protein n=1 Tax=Pseudomonas paralactis TaxID=1615673 RepID=A0A0R3AQ83_9PSED|nr:MULTISPECIES: fimbrial protein [Pseudomonas]KRP72531.1 pilus assembly protein [Pseudomonas paralactis]MBC3255442.1 type 1 fimbrial protein [Pseudomonas paralactis]MBJ2219886.1 type 1 fimbrial protein [Pseudomonas sp. MF7453]OKO49781.1 pilus assembly protein [Pseudomonas sp. BTN1]SFY01193.1 major type 1 subunit fimbrin (pilin) [Pseudomonas sp. NFR02]